MLSALLSICTTAPLTVPRPLQQGPHWSARFLSGPTPTHSPNSSQSNLLKAYRRSFHSLIKHTYCTQSKFPVLYHGSWQRLYTACSTATPDFPWWSLFCPLSRVNAFPFRDLHWLLCWSQKSSCFLSRSMQAQPLFQKGALRHLI